MDVATMRTPVGGLRRQGVNGDRFRGGGFLKATRLREEQLQQTEQFRKSHVSPRNILRFFREQRRWLCSKKIYNVVAKIMKNRMHGRNTLEEVLCLSAQQGYTVFYRNCEESNVLSDIVIAHPTSIAMIRTSSYVLITDTTYKTNRDDPTGKNFTVATAFMCNEHATTYRWALQQIKHLYVSSAMSTGNVSILNDEKYEVKSNPILKNVSNYINHMALKKIWLEIKKAGELSDDAQSKYGHYLRKSHGLPCACELFARYQHVLQLHLKDVYIFWRKLEIRVYIPSVK
ncbi:hypothetical protein M9H77_27150 [Catharanthus roseus]|uniref:Uncharacterized protein n=1 Tax=Catharanthus roseus TaxID=4058 RepID=A0ACC0AD47_CATRO|nr:hypothetical protein M9H77_27150 [Catharanthus roseus]